MTGFDGVEGIFNREKLTLEMERKQNLEDVKKKAEYILDKAGKQAKKIRKPAYH